MGPPPQASCEADLAAAEPLVAQAEAALDTLNKKDLGETKSLKKPPPGALRGGSSVMPCFLQHYKSASGGYWTLGFQPLGAWH